MIISWMIGDVDGCAVQPISQSQFTPLPEALCWVIWELNLAERSTGLEDVVRSLSDAFPDLVPPTHKVVYDTLGKLIRERKVRPFQHFFTRSATFNLLQNSFERRAEFKPYK
jgi:Winged helix Storkhead-box1 domain